MGMGYILRKAPPLSGLLVLGDTCIQGNIKRFRSPAEPFGVAIDNGAGKKVLISIESKRNFSDVNADIPDDVDPVLSWRCQDTGHETVDYFVRAEIITLVRKGLRHQANTLKYRGFFFNPMQNLLRPVISKQSEHADLSA
jgi:hypothetical protein